MQTSGIVVLNYQNADEVIRFVDAIKNYLELDYIVIVDNFSKDDSLEKLKRLSSKKIKILANKTNSGYAAGNNVGIRFLVEKKSCNNIFIANPDIVVSSDVISNMKEFLVNNSKCVVVAPQMITSDGGIQKNYWRLPTTLDDIVNTSVILSRIKGLFTLQKSNLKINKKVDVVLGAFFAIDAKFIKSVGYFNEGTFLYNEENILGVMVKNHGYEENILADNFYVHLGGTSSKDANILEKYKNYFNGMRLYHKNFRKKKKITFIILSLFMKLGLIEKYIIYQIRKVLNDKA